MPVSAGLPVYILISVVNIARRYFNEEGIKVIGKTNFCLTEKAPETPKKQARIPKRIWGPLLLL